MDPRTTTINWLKKGRREKRDEPDVKEPFALVIFEIVDLDLAKDDSSVC